MDIQSWVEALLLESPPGADFESPVLLAADADRIGDYVFETPGLPEMRGASAQLKRLNMEEMQKLLVQQGLPDGFVDGTPRGCLVYAAGGGILALVPESSGGKLAKALEQLYPESTGAATITCVVTPTSWQEVHKSFGALVERAGRMLRARKLEKAAVPFFEVLPFYRRCDACRKRPAVEILPPQGVGEAPEMRCRVCAAKRREGREHRSDWQIQLGAEAPKDLEEIGGPSKGYIGVVYADGNGIGDWFQGTTTIDDYRRRSKAVLKGVDTALKEALQAHCVAHQHPFEVLLVGGDDVLVVVPAVDALLVARDVCQRFSLDLQSEGLTMSAGVVIADHHTPVYFLRRLASGLLKNAKRNGHGSMVDFLLLKGQGTRDAEEARERVTIGTESLVLNHGPYSLTELDRLIKNVQEGKRVRFPQSQLYSLKEALRKGRQVSALEFLYTIARADPEQRSFLETFTANWFTESEETPSWHQGRTLQGGIVEYRTPWADLVDVWDFVSSEGGDEHA